MVRHMKWQPFLNQYQIGRRRVKKDPTFCCTSGWRWEVCDWRNNYQHTCQVHITIGTWNVRITLRMAGKLEEVSYEMSRYHWNILGLCKVQPHNRKTLARHPLRRVINYTSLARRTNTTKALDFLFTRTLWTLSWAAGRGREGGCNPLMGTCGQPGYVFFWIFVLNRVSNLSFFVLIRVSIYQFLS